MATVILNVCDRCGAVHHEKDEKPIQSAVLSLQWQGEKSETSPVGDVAKTALSGKASLCPTCTRAFLEFIEPNAIAQKMHDLCLPSAPCQSKGLQTSEVRAILRNPHGLRLLMDHHDLMHCELSAQAEPGETPAWPTPRWLELREMARAIIAEDPEIWDEELKRSFEIEHQ